MEYVLVVFAVWAVWTLLMTLFTADHEWVWIVCPLLLGVIGQCLIDWREAWLGLGIGGLAMVVMRFGDLLLVASDWIKFAVLRARRQH